VARGLRPASCCARESVWTYVQRFRSLSFGESHLHEALNMMRLTSFRAVLILAISFALPSGSLVAQASTNDECYDFGRRFFLTPAPDSKSGYAKYDSSAVVRLVGFRDSEVGAVVPLDARMDRWQLRNYARLSGWARAEPNRISVSWHNGFSGPVFDGVVRGDSIVGSIRFMTDHGREREPENARAVSVACPG
jgi:hypothetical protein